MYIVQLRFRQNALDPCILGKPDDMDATVAFYIISHNIFICTYCYGIDWRGIGYKTKKVINKGWNSSRSCFHDYVNVFDNTGTDRYFAAEKSRI